MMRRKESLYAIIGGIVGSILTMAVCSILPLGAQSQADSFGEINCTGLKVIDPSTGIEMIVLGVHNTTEPDGIEHIDGELKVRKSNVKAAFITMWGEYKTGPRVHIHGGTRGSIDLSGKDFTTPLSGGIISIDSRLGIDHIGNWGRVSTRVAESGGSITLIGKGGSVSIDIDDNGGGVKLKGKTDSTRSAVIEVDEHGGSVSVYGKGTNKSKAVICVNEYGNGAVSTWDKNGYRFATLK